MSSLFLLTALLAVSDEAEPAKPVFYETATVVARPVPSASASVTVIEAAEIEASGARSVGDLLQTMPGLHVLRSGGRGGVTYAGIRGGDPNFTLVLLDGVPLNDPTDPQGGAVNLEELPAGLVERLEVVRGPLCSFYGPSGLAGVVQLFTRRGEPGPVRAGLRGEVGNASLVRGSGTVSGPAGRGGYSAEVAFERERHRVAEEGFRQLDLHAGARLGVGATTDLLLTARFASGHADDYPDASGGPLYGSGLLRTTDHRDFSLGAELQSGGPDGFQHRVALGFSHRGLDRTSPAVPPLVPASEEQTGYSRLRLAWSAPLRRTARTQLDLGLSGEAERADNTSVLRLPPFLGGDVPGDYGKTRATGGGYLELRQERGPFLLEAALRADAATTDSLQINPRLGLLWRPAGGGTRLRAAAGRASKLPSFFALASPRALGGNPELRPERTVGGEIGLDHSFHRAHLELGATHFQHEYRDLVDFDFEAFTHVNRSRVRARGAELQARWRPLAKLEVQGEATWLDARDLSSVALLHRPRWLGGGRLVWRPTDRLDLRLESRGVSRYLDEQLPVPDRDTVAGYRLFAFAGSWRWRPRWTLRARVDNLGDRAYATLIGFPGPKRSFWVGLGWKRM